MILICNDFTFKDIFRKYPNQYEVIIGTLCENLDNLDEPEAKAAMIWIIGQYADRIENADVLLDDFLYCFLDEPVEVSALWRDHKHVSVLFSCSLTTTFLTVSILLSAGLIRYN